MEAETTVRQQYDAWSRAYDRLWYYYLANTLPVLATWTDVSPDDQVLDIGCGTGAFEKLLIQRHPVQPIVGVDLSAGMLERARRKLTGAPNVSFVKASADDLPLTAHRFDVVASASAFHYFRRPGRVLREMRRVLKPGGRIVILDWCRDYWTCQACDWLLHHIDPAHHHTYRLGEMHNLLHNAGLAVQRSATYRFGVLWGMMIVEARPA